MLVCSWLMVVLLTGDHRPQVIGIFIYSTVFVTVSRHFFMVVFPNLFLTEALKASFQNTFSGWYTAAIQSICQ